MAMSSVKCRSLCAYFLVFLFSGTICAQNEYYYYSSDLDNQNEFNLSTELLDDEERHILEKRDLPDLSSRLINQTIPFDKPRVTHTPILTQNTTSQPTENKTLTDNKLPSSKLKGTKKVLQLQSNATKAVEPSQKLLGVNGTGIRKNLTNLDVPKTIVSNVSLNTEHFDDLSIDSFPPDEESASFNQTLSKHNITNSTEDYHFYYNSTIINDPTTTLKYWQDLKNNPNAKINDLLSKSHRRAATIQLNFTFPFYGHKIKNVTIATGGFLYTGDYVHSWLAATQYIAPLMANFDTSISNDSYIRYFDNGTSFTVEWEKVVLQDKTMEGEYTFQTTIHENGDIAFVYKAIPVFIKNITDDHHPVKVGLSDAYIIDRTIFLVRRKTIYEYHRINFGKEEIKNGTVIYLRALPTCNLFTDCTSCISKAIPPFDCIWCSPAKRCSSGVDRDRQEWLTYRCPTKQLLSTCTLTSTTEIFEENNNNTYLHNSNELQQKLQDFAHEVHAKEPVKMGVSSVVAIMFLVAMVSGLAVWIFYAYRNPHTTSGQILIRYRPSQWRWRRGEARYTAATIHM